MLKTAKMEKEIVSKWVVEYGDDLYSWAFYKTSSRETAQDLIQETFLSAFKSYKKFKHESQPKTWLFKILNNKIIDYYRKSAKSLKGVELKDEEAHERMVNKLFDQKEAVPRIICIPCFFRYSGFSCLSMRSCFSRIYSLILRKSTFPVDSNPNREAVFAQCI